MYNVKLCPTSGACIGPIAYPTPLVPFSNLTLGMTYTATATAVVGGTTSPASNSLSFTMAASGVPMLTFVEDRGPTMGYATALAPPSKSYTNWVFTASPLGGGTAVTATSSRPAATFYGLTPATTVSAGCWCRAPTSAACRPSGS